MIPFSEFIIETSTLEKGIVRIHAPAIAAAIYRIGNTVELKGKKYRVSKHGPITTKGGMKYIDIELEPLGWFP
jgi:hypothetical protein